LSPSGRQSNSAFPFFSPATKSVHTRFIHSMS
jgi:hypothetical protein